MEQANGHPSRLTQRDSWRAGCGGKPHVRFERRAGETDRQKRRHGAPVRSHWATKALDEVRRQEWNKLRQAGAAKAAKAFKGLRFLLRRNWENLTGAQKGVIRDLEKANSRTFRAWQLKEELRDIFGLPPLKAARALDEWLAYASRSKLTPFVKLARTIRVYRASIEATIEWGFTNGIAESNNASIGRIRANARGFHEPHAFITMIMLERGGLAPDLPWATAS